MGLFGFSFGKKRRSKTRKSAKAHRKPPAKLLRLCKKYRVKATKKVGGKRHYKTVAVLKKLCLRKARALRKKLMKAHKRMHKRSAKSHRRGPSAFGARRRTRRSRASMFGAMGMMDMMGGFGKRRRVGARARVSKKHAMKAFRSFYKRHCAGRRGMGFGSNPPLSQSMGYSFCPDGMGGVLGPYSTGLYATPCQSPETDEMDVGSSGFGRYRRRRSTRRRSASAFGARCRKGYSRSKTGKSRCVRSTRRRVTRRKTVRKSRRRYNVAGSPCNIKKKIDCRSNPNCTYTRRGCRRRSGTKTGGLVYSGPMRPAARAAMSTAYGRRRRSTRRRSASMFGAARGASVTGNYMMPVEAQSMFGRRRGGSVTSNSMIPAAPQSMFGRRRGGSVTSNSMIPAAPQSMFGRRRRSRRTSMY